MKKSQIALLIGVFALVCTSAVLMPFPPGAAMAETVDNVDVYHYSKPSTNYTILGTVKLPGMVASERADKCLEILLKRAKKDFPSTQGLLVNTEFSKAECIKYNQP